MEIGHLLSFRPPRIDHDHPAPSIPFDLIEMNPRAPEAMCLVWIASEHYQKIAMLDVFRRMTILRTEEMAVHPKITGLFLGERVREVRGTHRAHQRHGEWPVRMITLSSAAIEREGIAAVD